MNFYFNNNNEYVDALEYLLYHNVGFSHDADTLKIDIRPIDHDQLPIYDETVVDRLNQIGKRQADDNFAEEISSNVAR